MDVSAAPVRHGVKRPVDLVHLARYTMGNRSLEREVLELFRQQSTLHLSRMQEAANERAWREAAHTVKGSAKGIGAWHVATTAEEAELLAGDEFDEQRVAVHDLLKEQIAEANAYIGVLLANTEKAR